MDVVAVCHDSMRYIHCIARPGHHLEPAHITSCCRDGVEQPLLWLQGLLAGRTGLGDTLSADASVLRMEEWMDESLEPCFIDRESLLPDEGLACCLLLSIGSLMLRGLKQMHCRQVLSLC